MYKSMVSVLTFCKFTEYCTLSDLPHPYLGAQVLLLLLTRGVAGAGAVRHGVVAAAGVGRVEAHHAGQVVLLETLQGDLVTPATRHLW